MSGFFRTLSAQALGVPSPVRSTARLPYGAAPLLADGSVASPPPGSPPYVDGDASLPPAPPTSVSVEPSPTGDRRAQGGHAPRDRWHDLVGAVAAREAPDAHARSGLDQPAAPGHPAHPSAVRAAAPLVAPATRFAVAGPVVKGVTAPADVASRTQGGAPQETTEVHVTIGRIELTAVHEPAPRQRRGTAAASSVTLNEYLAQRSKGRR